MSKKQDGCGIEFAPLRPLDDFLLDSARFQIPNVQDFGRWGNRVGSNLLYYQTNYFLLAFSIFGIMGIIHPVRMICGFLVTTLIFLIFLYITTERHAAAQFKKQHPILTLLMLFASLYTVAYMLQSLLVFMLGILLPISVIFIHSSLRLRNIKNKIANHVEALGMKITPMGFFLAAMGLLNENL